MSDGKMNVKRTTARTTLDRMLPVRRSMQLNEKSRAVFKTVEEEHKVLEKSMENLLKITDKNENKATDIKSVRAILKEADLDDDLVVKVERHLAR